MKQAQVFSSVEGESLIITIKGEIDHHSAGIIRQEIDREGFFHRCPRVILDLSGIDFMDSSGLGLILGRYTRIKDMGSTLILKDPTQEIVRILKLSGVDKFIKIKKSTGIREKETKNSEGRAFGDEKNY